MILRILADDLTGALDTAARFVPMIGPVPVLWSDDVLQAGTAALDTGTRERDSDGATATMRQLVSFLGAGEIAFKKIDSLLRGQVAAELAVCLACFDHVVVAPAFPFQGRITRGGRQLVRDGAGWRAVGPETLPAPLLDAETDADLDRIVAAGRRLPGRVLWCGTAGLAGALAGHAPVPRLPLRGPVLALIGSDHPITRDQVAAARAASMSAGRLCVPDLGVPAGTSRAEAARIIADRLAVILRAAARPGVLFVSGGETLRAVCHILGAERLVVDGEIEPGAPCAILVGGAWDGQLVVAKSGAFGDRMFLHRLAREAG